MDPDARAGYRTVTRRKQAGYFAGYHLHIGVGIPEYRWNGDPTVSTGRQDLSEEAGYIFGAKVTTASSHSGHAGNAVVNSAREIAPQINEVVVDRGYTCVKAETFLRKMHSQGLNVVMDYNTYQLKRIRTVVIT